VSRNLQQHIRADFHFPVYFGRGIFERGNTVLRDVLCQGDSPRPRRVIALIDRGVGAADSLRDYISHHAGLLQWAGEPSLWDSGEEVKDGLAEVLRMVDVLVEARLCRHSYVLAVGGGALLDAAGLAASLVHRGLRLVRIPTTVLSQCDSGVGVKNGVNYRGQKNLLGAFAPPFAVLNDFDFLPSLSQEAWIGGVAEAFKVALIKDADFFDFLCASARALRDRDEALMEKTIIRCAELHLGHIRGSGDPFESGSARPLDFGHWAAHELERLSLWKLGHGQAVAMGIALDSRYAWHQGWLRENELLRIEKGLIDCGFSLRHSLMRERDGQGRLLLLRGLENFREHLGGRLCITFPDGIGHKMEVHEIDPALMEQCLLETESE